MRGSTKMYEEELRRYERRLDKENRAKIFGTKLTEAIKNSGMTIREIEKKTFIHYTTLYNYTSGKTSPDIYNLMSLAKVLKSSIGDLYPL